MSENLLRLGCDIHVADNEGNMPWHSAASGGNLKVSKKTVFFEYCIYEVF